MRKNIVFFTATLLLFSALAAGSWGADQNPGQNPTVIKSIGYLKLDKGLEAAVRIDGDFLYQSLVLSNPTRLVVDIAPVQKIDAQAYYEVNVFGMKSIRTGQFTPLIARVIFDFTGPLPAYEIQKTESGITVKFTPEEPKPEKAAALPLETKPAQALKEVKEEAKVIVPKEEQEFEEMKYPGFFNTTVGFMVGTYHNPSADFREVYGSKTDMQYGLNLSRTLIYYRGLQLDASLEARTYSKNGSSTLDQTPAKFSMKPITLTGHVLYQTKYAMPFVGIGKDWYSYKEESTLANTSGSTSGWHYELGVYIIIPRIEYLRVKLYYKFAKATTTENDISIDLGGNEYGLGVSFGFNFLRKGILTF